MFTFHCNPLPAKRKAFFGPASTFFSRPPHQLRRRQQELQPEIPQRPHGPAEQAEEQHPAPQGPHEHEQAQLPVPRHGEEEQARHRQHAEKPVQHPAPHPPPQPPQGPQQVVDQPQRPPQQDGAQEHGQLLRYVVAQLHQPNSRRKSPPCPPEGPRSS